MWIIVVVVYKNRKDVMYDLKIVDRKVTLYTCTTIVMNDGVSDD